MIYTLIIHNSPFQNSCSAYYFAKALLNKGHKINCIFFYGDAVYTASKDSDYPSDEKPISFYWQELKLSSPLNLIVCMNAASKRGILKQNILPEFTLGTLGQFSEACSNSDKIITFKN